VGQTGFECQMRGTFDGLGWDPGERGDRALVAKNAFRMPPSSLRDGEARQARRRRVTAFFDPVDADKIRLAGARGHAPAVGALRSAARPRT